ncbi:MAG TPA: FtsW/RodA/SpoVE family cell cycle protein [Patescibacteria group bacterium]|nr:FtsW/RodA/SpoVE family cell cycle protein [Patescibacteria group bacterium]
MFSAIFRPVDWFLVIPVIILLFLSQVTLFTIDPLLFRSQFIFTLLASLVFLFCCSIDIRMLAELKIPIYLISISLLLFLLLIGLESHGAVRWLDILGFHIQFSEIFKPFLCIGLAAFLSERSDRSLKTFLTICVLLLPLVLIIDKQPDLGTAMIYALTTFLALLFAGFPLWWFALGLLVSFGSVPVLWQFLHEYQRQRLLTFLHMSNDPLGTSYNAIQAVIAVGSGMFFGKGFGQGTQSALRFLPERQTDFIFATIGEDLGFTGAILLIGVFLFLLYRFYMIYQESDDTFSKLFVATAFSLLLIQFFVNVGMNIGVMPVVGVALPFVSYGGSSLIANAILLGFVSAIGSRVRKKHVLEIG